MFSILWKYSLQDGYIYIYINFLHGYVQVADRVHPFHLHLGCAFCLPWWIESKKHISKGFSWEVENLGNIFLRWNISHLQTERYISPNKPYIYITDHAKIFINLYIYIYMNSWRFACPPNKGQGAGDGGSFFTGTCFDLPWSATNAFWASCIMQNWLGAAEAS